MTPDKRKSERAWAQQAVDLKKKGLSNGVLPIRGQDLIDLIDAADRAERLDELADQAERLEAGSYPSIDPSPHWC